MDFIVLFVLYIVLCVLAVVLYLSADAPLLKQGPIGRIRALVFQILSALFKLSPKPVREGLRDVFDYILYQRNCFFQVLYVVLVLAGYLILVFDGMPYLYASDSETNHVFWPMVLLLVNMALFVVSCQSDAGQITQQTLPRYKDVYAADGVMYTPENTCSTCLHVKPPRSKHCAISNQCVFKFDHYCAWTNNAVGGLNHRYFLLFLVSLCAMMANGAFQMGKALVSITSLFKLMSMQYLDAAGNPQPMNFRVLSQTLFMQFPRSVFLVAALCALSVFILAFTIYHGYLALSNQTTNERYKKHYLRVIQNKPVQRNPYNRGLIENVLEEIFPLRRAKQVKKKKVPTATLR